MQLPARGIFLAAGRSIRSSRVLLCIGSYELGNVSPMTTSILTATRLQIGRRGRQLGDILAKDGYRGVIDRARSAASNWVKPRTVVWPVFTDDVLAADLDRPPPVVVPKVVPGEPIIVNWVTSAAGPGSGGHTTMYRIIRYLQERGYTNRVYLNLPYGGDQKYYEAMARQHYGITCQLGNVRSGMDQAHAIVATGWAEAYALYNSRCPGKRFYLIQDYEPYFYPVGTNSVLAENTYKMGFHGITAGKWLATKLRREFGMSADHFPFGCDAARYQRFPNSKRTGVAFYARAGTPRRAVELGLLALELFARRRPEVELHFFGERLGTLPFSFVNHGLVSPQQLNAIYNRCYAGLTLSLTNVSLVPNEMMACGCIPVINDAEHNRLVLDNPHVRYAAATPHALAGALEAVVSMPNFEDASMAAAKSLASTSWDDAGAAVDAAFRKALGS